MSLPPLRHFQRDVSSVICLLSMLCDAQGIEIWQAGGGHMQDGCPPLLSFLGQGLGVCSLVADPAWGNSWYIRLVSFSSAEKSVLGKGGTE